MNRYSKTEIEKHIKGYSELDKDTIQYHTYLYIETLKIELTIALDLILALKIKYEPKKLERNIEEFKKFNKIIKFK